MRYIIFVLLTYLLIMGPLLSVSVIEFSDRPRDSSGADRRECSSPADIGDVRHPMSDSTPGWAYTDLATHGAC